MYQKIVDNFVFNIGDDSANLAGWSGDASAAQGLHQVPTFVDGKPVTTIEDNAFECTYLEYLMLPSSIASIGKKAFRGGSIKGVQFYVEDEHYCQETLKVSTSAFKDCILMEYFNTLQFVEAEYLAFCGCPKLQLGKPHPTYFHVIHPEAFASSQKLKEIYVLQDGHIQVNALKNSSITDVHLAENAKIPEKTLDYIRDKGITLHVFPESPLMNLAYDGISVKEALPF